jgi:hypothetical protein
MDFLADRLLNFSNCYLIWLQTRIKPNAK